MSTFSIASATVGGLGFSVKLVDFVFKRTDFFGLVLDFFERKAEWASSTFIDNLLMILISVSGANRHIESSENTSIPGIAASASVLLFSRRTSWPMAT